MSQFLVKGNHLYCALFFITSHNLAKSPNKWNWENRESDTCDHPSTWIENSKAPVRFKGLCEKTFSASKKERQQQPKYCFKYLSLNEQGKCTWFIVRDTWWIAIFSSKNVHSTEQMYFIEQSHINWIYGIISEWFCFIRWRISDKGVEMKRPEAAMYINLIETMHCMQNNMERFKNSKLG